MNPPRTRSNLSSTLLLALLSLPGASCAGPSSPAPVVSPAPSPFAVPRPTADGAFYVRCTPTPPAIPLNRIFSLDITVYTDAAFSLPAPDVRIDASADMPEHGHGMNLSPRVARTGPGTFHVDGMLMHMPGAWEIYIDVSRDGTPHRATFPVLLQ